MHEPRKRPRCSLTRFEAELPNELWQVDITAWQLADGKVEFTARRTKLSADVALAEVATLLHKRLFCPAD